MLMFFILYFFISLINSQQVTKTEEAIYIPPDSFI